MTYSIKDNINMTWFNQILMEGFFRQIYTVQYLLTILLSYVIFIARAARVMEKS